MIIKTMRIKFLVHTVALLLAALLYGDASVPTRDWLGSESVVLVCGAASFLGSEVSLALHSVHAPKKLILVDELADLKKPGGLSVLEFQRQRVFRVLQTIANSDTTDGIFYRVDLRPEVPEFLDSSVVPMLDYIVKEHPDITHIVYLPEDKTLNDRASGNPRAVLMHAILDQIHNWKNATGFDDPPQFTYSSSYQVYSGDADAINGPYEGREDQSIHKPPISQEGSAHLMDEILAESYYKSFQVDSIGLRMFTPYGPFDTPSSTVAKIVSSGINSLIDSTQPITLSPRVLASKKDYIFIDDAVDAIMIAMQVRAPKDFGPLFVNIGSGHGVDIRSIVNVVKSLTLVPSVQFPKAASSTKISEVLANTDRSKKLLGWEPVVPLEEGIRKTVGWHFDRAFPQGSAENTTAWKVLARAGRLGCDMTDTECLRGSVVYPCASDCAHSKQCLDSIWDSVVWKSQRKSESCSNVWYTVALNHDLESLPSVDYHASVQSNASGFAKCNFAFVSIHSPLYQRLQHETSGADETVQYAHWTLLPVPFSSSSDVIPSAMSLLPKISPVTFFSEAVELAIYTESFLIIDDVQTIIKEAKMQPYNAEAEGTTALLAGLADSHSYLSGRELHQKSEIHQKAAYRMMHIKSLDWVSDNDGFQSSFDSSFLIHRLQNEDARALRCDVFQEVWSWNVPFDQDAWSFIGGLHDMWAQVMVQQEGRADPWWHEENVESVPEAKREHRRLQEAEEEGLRKAPLQYHHLLSNKLGDHAKEAEHTQEFYHHDENGLGVTLGVPIAKMPDRVAPAQTSGNPDTRERPTSAGGHDVSVQKDKWLGILSSQASRSFIRLIRPEEVGIVDLRSRTVAM